jgi:YidC/Oxa1 family membrane protein insertase
MDRNSVIGFSLLAALLIGYIAYNNYSQKQYQEQRRQQEIADSLALARTKPAPLADTAVMAVSDPVSDTVRQQLPAALNGVAEQVRLENEKIALVFSTKGGHPVSAEIKNYKTFDKKPLYLFNSEQNRMSLELNNGALATSDLYFTPRKVTTPEGTETLEFTADLENGQQVRMTYSLPRDEYMMRCNVQLTGFQGRRFPLTWELHALHTEQDIETERSNSQVYYRFTNKDHDYFTIGEGDKKSLGDPVHWVGFRLHYFSTALIDANGFTRADISASNKTGNNRVVASNAVVFDLPVKDGKDQEFSFDWYIGPNHYNTLKAYQIGLDDMVPLGYGIFAFVKYINKWLIIPVFDLLSKFISNYGVIIMLLTVFIRLLLSFFTYKSYLSSAKMRVLKPELDELRKQYGDDQQRFGMEQMKLYRSAGVNPLGGCLPMLLQLPILFAMFYFFPSSIELRQESFLWAHDLSTYDSIAKIPNIPFFGDHISLFTLLMTASSMFLALYNRNMTPQDPNNPVMKYLPFIFPIILMGVFNKMAAALTFYYFFSIIQQFIIQKFIIDEKKIHAQIQENRNKPATPSKWQQRMEEMQKAQMERMKQKPLKK